MAIKFRKKAIKFLEKANPEDVENIREKINKIFIAVEDQGIIPFTELVVCPIKISSKRTNRKGRKEREERKKRK